MGTNQRNCTRFRPSVLASLPPSLPPSKVPASRHHEKGSKRGSERGRGRPTKASLAMPPAAPFVARRSAAQGERAGIYAPSCSGRRRRRRRDVRTWIGRPTAGASFTLETARWAGWWASGALTPLSFSSSLALFVPRLRVGLVDDDGGDAMRCEGQETRRASRTINATRIIVRRKEGRREGRGEDEMGRSEVRGRGCANQSVLHLSWLMATNKDNMKG